MKNSINPFKRQSHYAKMLVFLAVIILSPDLYGQMDCQVSGKIIEENSKQAVPFATVIIMTDSENGSDLLSGLITDENGEFIISDIKSGKYRLKISSVGYKTTIKRLNINDSGMYDAGIIYLQDSIQMIDEVVVLGERPKAKTENDKTTFLMSKKILAASGNAPDLLRHIPGIEVDLKQNISLDGSQNILLLVNGKERDKSYISQINPSLVDRVEIINTPPSNYDGSASGLINIVLKKDIEKGFSGQIFTEIPTSESIVYSFPNYNLQYSFKKGSLFTSYNGEINFEDIDETYNMQIFESGQTIDITSVEQVRQKNLSHKFHYGFDYYSSPKDIINFYGSVNPYSYEQDGKAFLDISGDEDQSWNTLREESDKNLNIFNSLYYKHLFNKKGHELVLDLSNSSLKASSSVAYLSEDENDAASFLNKEKPEQASTSIKIDYSSPLGENTMLNTGAKAEVKTIRDETSASFAYNEQVYALYGMLQNNKPKYSLNLGLRIEYNETEINNDINNTGLSVLPYLTFQYKLNDRQNLLLSFRRSIYRPNVFQLNPYISINNPYYIRKGNPMLKPELRNRIYAEHSIRFNVSYLSYRLFYDKRNNAINNLTFLNDSAAFETQVQNLGNIHQLGIQFLGSLKFGALSISPSVRLYRQSTSVNKLASNYNIENRSNWVFDASLSSILSFKDDFAFSGTFQYSTMKYHIQDKLYSDALYILSVDKTFKNKLKVGIMAALPFANTFVYQGTENEAQNFTSSYQGKLKLPTIPVMFRISYSFQTGKKKALISREKEDLPRKIKSGF